jgi:DNA-binding IscR family transcriptional regulator
MSKKCKYAIKALVKLAENKDKGNMFTQDISDTAHITKKFITNFIGIEKSGIC